MNVASLPSLRPVRAVAAWYELEGRTDRWASVGALAVASVVVLVYFIIV